MPLIPLKNNLRIADTQYAGDYKYSCGNVVPIFDVYSTSGLNQIIGHAKFNNKDIANVYYRGECELHNQLLPSLFRKYKKTVKAKHIRSLINSIMIDHDMQKSIKINGDIDLNAVDSAKIEGMLQHYGIKTRFIDLVDNHWVSLWMGNYKNCETKRISKYYHYYKREIQFLDFINNNDNIYQYILLVAIPNAAMEEVDGVKISDNFIEVDLRKALPSVFLRPHAQHGIVVRKKMAEEKCTDDYDLASQIIGILRIRIDMASLWLGNGELLSQANLFPPPSYDCGYDILLSRTDLFTDPEYQIAKYI
ncbi:MAG: FRG domain-containing protein [Bacteroidetes bacterium]|uniref:FRG domain-containing protein n=1 Tax=Candidatus Cryptobacteroides faecigallinarum TaxID=2840763 RepID=A0A9D9NIT6_9BACT|nr:FRG domain-containing protein [Candidatus Cryptobacteroides faecigallinarum]